MNNVFQTQRAHREFKEVYDYWINRNKSDLYSESLLNETLRIIRMIIENPEIGLETKKNKLRRMIVHRTYSLTYKVENENIRIVSFFDGRKKPKD